MLEGLHAYAQAQAAAETRLAQQWETKWAPIRLRAEEFLKTTHLSAVCSLYPPTVVSNATDVDESSMILSQVEVSLEDPMEDDDEWD